MLTVRSKDELIPADTDLDTALPAVEEDNFDPSPKHFQNLRVSSAAADATVVPSGD